MNENSIRLGREYLYQQYNNGQYESQGNFMKNT